MDHHQKEKIARLVKQSRLGKGYTQQELSEISGISLRSVQRIENAEVLPRMYTLKLLSRHLGFSTEIPVESEPFSQDGPITPSGSGLISFNLSIRRLNRQQKSILSGGAGIVLILLLMAFMAQSSSFPETSFEFFLLLAGATCCYILTLLIIWK